jgi:hypothetical protein
LVPFKNIEKNVEQFSHNGACYGFGAFVSVYRTKERMSAMFLTLEDSNLERSHFDLVLAMINY